MQTATIAEVQARLPELLQQVGAGEEVLIVSAGKPVGKLVPVALPTGTPILGRGQGKLIKYVEDDEHLKDFGEYMP